MKLVPYDASKVAKHTKVTDLFKTLEEFANSTYDCVKIEDYPHVSAEACYGAFHNAIKRYHMEGIRCFRRGKNVFLIRAEIER